MEVLTPSSASGGLKDFGAASPAGPTVTASSASSAQARVLRGAILGLNGNPHPTQEVGRQHAARAHDHCIVADLEHLSLQLDRDLLAIDLLDVRLQHYAQRPAIGCLLHAFAVARFGAIERLAAIREHHAATAGLG